MNPLRISIVEYLNTAPLVRGFTHGPLRGKYELSFTVPSECAEALRSGDVDVAIIPANSCGEAHRAGPQFAQHPGIDADSLRKALAHRAGIFRSRTGFARDAGASGCRVADW